MTFERLVHHERFVSQLLTTAVGALGLQRPKAVWRADGKVSVQRTATVLQQAHLKAVHEEVATMVTALAVPFVGMETNPAATPVKPDFAIVAPRHERASDGSAVLVGSWLIMGDAKDYERVRSRIDDQRLLKGFLQVALGAESVAEWSAVPAEMLVHRWGALAVPRNAFLQPEAVVERLDDYRIEVRARVDERTNLLEKLGGEPIDSGELDSFVAHLEATFDPASCSTCPMFNYCRGELRASTDPLSLLVEIGIRPEARAALVGLVDGSTGLGGRVPGSLVAQVRATTSGLPQWTTQRRVDPVGAPGSIAVVLAKSDSAALGIHGMATKRWKVDGSSTDWAVTLFDEPQSPTTRLETMRLLGEQIDAARADLIAAAPMSPGPVHLLLPDSATGDVLVSIADSLAGVETSRLRWQRDIDKGRVPLTFNGEPAVVPAPLSKMQRLGVSFLLEEDRARAMTLRWPLVDARAVLRRHVIAGGPSADSGRLDYLVIWAEATMPLDHRAVSDSIAESEHTPGARLSNARSDAIHRARPRTTNRGPTGDEARYGALIVEELTYKTDIMDRVAEILSTPPTSRLRAAHQALEADAQAVWDRRLALHASDLVRFGRTNWVWRNSHVTAIDQDMKCARQLEALASPEVAGDLAVDAGTREVAMATVLSTNPLRLLVQSRRIGHDSTIVVLHLNGVPVIEESNTTMKVQVGSFKFGGLNLGPLEADDQTINDDGLCWTPKVIPDLSVGDTLIVADARWFGERILTSGHEITIDRPKPDTQSAPKPDCHAGSYGADPTNHQYCCRSHERSEAEFSDELAARRARGELNPEAWPPILDEDQFDVLAANTPTDTDPDVAQDSSPAAHLTLDDLD